MPDTAITQACDSAIATLDQLSALLSRIKVSVKRIRQFPVPDEVRESLITAITSMEKGFAAGGVFKNFETLEKTYDSIERTLKDLVHHRH